MAGPRLQVEQVATEDSSQLLNVVFDEASGSIAIDYSPYYERIASAAESIATAVTSGQLATQTERIADSLETSDSSKLADNLQSMVVDINAIKVLAETTGIKTISPHRWMELVAVYKYLVEDGTVLQPASVTPAQIEQAKEKIVEFLDKIKDLPTGTD